MRAKRKISVTIDSDLLDAVENASKMHKMAKSHLAQEAFRLWLKMKTEKLMAEGYADMATEDKAFSELTLDAQKEILT